MAILPLPRPPTALPTPTAPPAVGEGRGEGRTTNDAPSSPLNPEPRPLTTERAVHLCFGNYGGQSIQHGTWAKLTDFLNALHADHVVLEFAHRDPAELQYLNALRPDLAIGLGVINIKTNTVESPDQVAARIDHAAQTLGPDRIKWVHPDCGFWMNKRSIADRKMEALVKGRDLYLGRG